MSIPGGTGEVAVQRTSSVFREVDAGPQGHGGLYQSFHRMEGQTTNGLLPDDLNASLPSTPRVIGPLMLRSAEATTPSRIITDYAEALDEESIMASTRTIASMTSGRSSHFTDRVSEQISTSPSLISQADPRPVNFGEIVPGLYRSSYPRSHHYGFIEALDLRCVLSLVQPDEADQGFDTFMVDHDIRHHVIGICGTKKGSISLPTIKAILKIILNRDNHPMLLHCNQGRHRTGCVIAVVRKLSGWLLPDILDEYKSYAEPKVRSCDIDYITAFRISDLLHAASQNSAAIEISWLLSRPLIFCPSRRTLAGVDSIPRRSLTVGWHPSEPQHVQYKLNRMCAS